MASILMHHKGDQPPQYVDTEKQAAALGDQWVKTYVHKRFPCCLYNAEGKTVTAANEAAEEAYAAQGYGRKQVLPPPAPEPEKLTATEGNEQRILRLEVAALQAKLAALEPKHNGAVAVPTDPPVPADVPRGTDAAPDETPAPISKAERLAAKQAEARARNTETVQQ